MTDYTDLADPSKSKTDKLGILRARYKCTKRIETEYFYECIMTPAPFDQEGWERVYQKIEVKFWFEKFDPKVPEVGTHYLIERSGTRTVFIKLN